MATKLTREVVRETDIEAGGRKLVVHLHPDQRIGFKLKGLKGEPHFYNLVYVYDMLMRGDDSNALESEEKEDVSDDERVCAETIIKDINKDVDIPYPYKRELVKYFRKKYGIK